MSAPQVVAGDAAGLIVAVRGLRPPHWMTSNHRYRHWSIKARQTAEVRSHGHLWGRAMRDACGPIDTYPVRIVATLHFLDRRRRDVGNLAPTTKALIDGLVDAGLLVDDSSAHVIGPDHRLGGTSSRGSTLDLEIWSAQ